MTKTKLQLSPTEEEPRQAEEATINKCGIQDIVLIKERGVRGAAALVSAQKQRKRDWGGKESKAEAYSAHRRQRPPPNGCRVDETGLGSTPRSLPLGSQARPPPTPLTARCQPLVYIQCIKPTHLWGGCIPAPPAALRSPPFTLTTSCCVPAGRTTSGFPSQDTAAKTQSDSVGCGNTRGRWGRPGGPPCTLWDTNGPLLVR